jgi:hypothetical protein
MWRMTAQAAQSRTEDTMTTAARLHREAVSADEQRLRADAVRAGIASARIEGGDVGAEAQAIMNEWAQGLIDNNTMTARIDALHAT